jgi:hypothetical protein
MRAAGHTYAVLSDDEVALIHQGALRILGEMGLQVENERLLSRLADAGLPVDLEDERVRFPGRLWPADRAPAERIRRRYEPRPSRSRSQDRAGHRALRGGRPAHQRGTQFGYICSSGTSPLLDDCLEAGIDALIGIDPVQGTFTDMPLMREKLGGNSGAVTVEMGSEQEVRAAVRHAIQTPGPNGLILSPVYDITVDTPQTWRNVDVQIDNWRASIALT